jgi:hypothetical protein
MQFDAGIQITSLRRPARSNSSRPVPLSQTLIEPFLQPAMTNKANNFVAQLDEDHLKCTATSALGWPVAAPLVTPEPERPQA